MSNITLNGSCHCGAVQWQRDGLPEDATACNCTSCRCYGSLWAYGYQGENIRVSGETQAYVRSDAQLQGEPNLASHFCPTCGNVAYWRGLTSSANGRRRIAVNLRLATEPALVANVPLRHFDGLDKWEDLPLDGKCVNDVWY